MIADPNAVRRVASRFPRIRQAVMVSPRANIAEK